MRMSFVQWKVCELFGHDCCRNENVQQDREDSAIVLNMNVRFDFIQSNGVS
jgi:hypothetical protein